MALAVRSLGSGSSGNALVVDTGTTVIAVDCGIGARALAAGLAAAGRRLADLDAVLLSHEHADHVRAVPQVIKVGVPFVATAGTVRAAGLPAAGCETIRPEVPLRIGDLSVIALRVSHDAAEPCGFHLSAPTGNVTVVTDLGRPDENLHAYLIESDLIVLEANHDETMVHRGPYPVHLKRRVLSSSGHLSNDDCGRLLATALGDDERRRTIWLAHLSTTNNRAPLARQAVEGALAAGGRARRVVPLPRHGHDQIWRPDETIPVVVQVPRPFG